jgi:hypothetical protein
LKQTNEADQTRASARSQREAQQRAEAEAVWKQVRAEEKSTNDKTARLRALRLAKELEESREAEPPKRKAAAATRVRRSRVSAQ